MMEQKDKNVKFSTAIYAFFIVIIIFLVILGLLIYRLGFDNKFTQMVSKVVPYPAAVINYNDFINLTLLQNNLVAVRKFYESQDFSQLGYRVDFNTLDGKKRLKIKEKNLLNKLIENEIIKKLATQRGIKISSEIVNQEVDRKINQSSSRDFVLANMKNLYGWDIADFQEKIVTPDMYKQQLQQSVQQSDKGMTDAKNKINQALKELEDGKDFGEVAKTYSEGESAKSGGELGWLTLDQMIPEIAAAATVLNKGEKSGIIESALGFHIVKIDDRKTENDVESIKLSQIFVRSKNFSDWLFEQEKSFKVYIPLKDYYWDKDSQSVQFTSPGLRDFEKNLQENSPDDISMMF
jgi:parvulin-like peptidyl-prolyl isomerase